MKPRITLITLAVCRTWDDLAAKAADRSIFHRFFSQ